MTGLCLAIAGADTGPGARVIQWSCNEYPDKYWKFVPVNIACPAPYGCFEIVNENSHLCMAAINGGSIIQWSCSPNPTITPTTTPVDEVWEVNPNVVQGQIIDYVTGYCLAIAGAGGPPGPGVGDVIVWPCDSNWDKYWYPFDPLYFPFG